VRASPIDSLYSSLLRSPRLDQDPWSRTNLQIFRPRHTLLWEEISRHLPEPRETIADIGCHNAFFLRLSLELGFTRFLGVDFFELPPERSFLQELPNAHMLRANFNSEDFLGAVHDASVDCVVSTEVLEHLYQHPAGYLAECWRILKPGGLLLLSTPNPCNLTRAAKLISGRSPVWGDVAFARTPKTTSDGEPLAVWDIHFREYTLPTVRELLGDLEGAQVLAQGFIANAPSARSGAAKNLALGAAWRAGLGHMRLLAASEYLVARRDGAA
jgi:2-polyprenyl-3-methyl-5-hydroxy-6-metoxy-1,4-benzoquinol methylase